MFLHYLGSMNMNLRNCVFFSHGVYRVSKTTMVLACYIFNMHQPVFTVRLHAMQRTVLLSQFCLSICLSVCLSVRPSDVCIVTKHCRYFDTTRNGNHSSFWHQHWLVDDPPSLPNIHRKWPTPSKNADFGRFPLITSEP